MLANVGQLWPDPGQVWPEFDQYRPSVAQFLPKLCKFCSMMTTACQFRAKLGPSSARSSTAASVDYPYNTRKSTRTSPDHYLCNASSTHTVEMDNQYGARTAPVLPCYSVMRTMSLEFCAGVAILSTAGRLVGAHIGGPFAVSACGGLWAWGSKHSFLWVVGKSSRSTAAGNYLPHPAPACGPWLYASAQRPGPHPCTPPCDPALGNPSPRRGGR